MLILSMFYPKLQATLNSTNITTIMMPHKLISFVTLSCLALLHTHAIEARDQSMCCYSTSSLEEDYSDDSDSDSNDNAINRNSKSLPGLQEMAEMQEMLEKLRQQDHRATIINKGKNRGTSLPVWSQGHYRQESRVYQARNRREDSEQWNTKGEIYTNEAGLQSYTTPRSYKGFGPLLKVLIVVIMSISVGVDVWKRWKKRKKKKSSDAQKPNMRRKTSIAIKT